MRSYCRLLCIALLLALAATPAAAQPADPPNDPRFDDQWALRTIGAQCAWTTTIGSTDVIVAVIDSGVDMNHPDLADRLLPGRDFVEDDDDPSDTNGHGTNVAGIIAATLDNAEGVAGLAPGVSILPVRVMNARGYGSDNAIAQGIRYAADQGARVINLSLGATLMISAEEESETVSAAIRYAQRQGALVVVAAGNDFVPLPNAIVGDNPDVLVVAALDPYDRKADFSNSGPWVGVSAPGVQILSTMPTYEVFLNSSAVPRDERFRLNYDFMSGTSQATPFVSALAALLFSAHPEWDARQVADQIRATAVDISTSNRRLELGSGRIDACAALAGVGQPSPTPQAGPESPTAPRGGQASGLLFGLLACGAAFIVLLIFAMLAGVRLLRPRPAPQPRPAPAPVVPPIPAPAPQATPPGATVAWGTLTVIGGIAPIATYPLAGMTTLIGRSDECAIILGDPSVSRRHALVRNNGQQVTLEDLGSTHGTFLNGRRVSGPTSVRSGDVAQLGRTQLRFG